MLWPALLALISTQSDCRPGIPSDGGVAVLSLDLDGDPVPDEVRVLHSDVEIHLSRPRAITRLSLSLENSGSLVVPLGKLPLRGNRRQDEALRFIEDTFFSKTCPAPDPAFARLQQQQGPRGSRTPLRWIEGPPRPTFSYLLRQKSSWVMFRPYCYVPGGNDPFGPTPLEEAASEGGLVVMKTCHGVLVNDLENGRYAWLYLLDQYVDKLRHRSIGEVTIADGVVTIQLTLDLLEYPDFVEARVRIADGAITMVKGKREQ
jgi:hypothetical protein